MSTCKYCIHYDPCSAKPLTPKFCGTNNNCGDMENLCDMFKDKSKFIELPCSIGDTVYKIYYDRGSCANCDSYADFFGLDPICDENKTLFPEINDNKECICNKHHLKISKYNADLNWIIWQLDQFGETVFLTREEAEKKLEELK